MIAFDPVISPFSVDMRDTVEMRIVAPVLVTDRLAVRRRLIGADRDRSMQPNPLDRLAQEGFGRLGIAAGGQPEIDQMTVPVDRPPKVAPLTTDHEVGLIHMPVEADPAAMPLGTFGQFRPELLDPSIDRRAIDEHTPPGQKIGGVLIRDWVAKIHPNRAEDNDGGKPMALEGLTTGHGEPHFAKQSDRIPANATVPAAASGADRAYPRQDG